MSIGALEYGTMAMGLFGGLAIFLFGLEQMTDALKSVAGAGMKKLLARLTTNRFKAVLAGGLVTSVIQSSSVTTVLTVGFVSAGLMSLEQSIGIIMGAEIGTTITAQIIAFKVTHYALAIVAIGFVLQFFFKSERVRQYGIMILGFGLVFFGMNLMKGAMAELGEYQPFLDLMQRMDNPLLAILTSALFTGLVQSSSATTGVVIALGSEGLISLEAAIALVLGANIGTCVTALLASIGKPRVAVQTAMVHVLFNVAGVCLWFGLIPLLADTMRDFSSNLPRQIANAHTTFNLLNTVIFIGFTPLFARAVRRLVPLRPEVEERARPKYLDDNLLETPELALDRVRLEIVRMGELATDIVRRAPEIVAEGSRADLDRLRAADDDVDALHGAIITYLGRLSQESLTEPQTELLHDNMTIANYIENMADVVETNLVHLGHQRLGSELAISPETRMRVEALADLVVRCVVDTLESVRSDDIALARSVIEAKPEIGRLAQEAQEHLMRRLVAQAPQRREAFQIESEIVETLKRIYYNAKRIAKAVAQVEMSYLRPESDTE